VERMRIVVAERDAAFRKNLKEMLTQAGYLVVGEAADGMSAIKLIHGLQPEMVLASASLPVLNGLELAKIIEESRLAALVLMVDYGEKDLVYGTGDRWSVPVLVKPFDQFHLVSILEYTNAVFCKMAGLEGEVHRLRSDLETRKIVEKAKGILMKAQKLTEEEAFKRIQQQSMKKRTSMKNIAEAIITAFELSDDG
ncbi:MAG: ANTAR domain-containing response regulator, partial [Eubacteriales bacterium]